MIFRLHVKVKVISQRSRSPCQKCDFRIFCMFYLGVKVKGDMGQGQRSHWPGSNEGPKERQVGSHQRQVASLHSVPIPK